MWRPGFEYIENHEALAWGYRRALCVRSFVHRGTPERPGLVLGLDRGGSCRGIAFKVSGSNYEEVMDYLRARELVTHVYKERHVTIELASRQRLRATTYVVDRFHEQYAGALSVEEAARSVSGAVGKSGRNEEYVQNTVEHLRQMQIKDQWLEGVAGKISSSSVTPEQA